MLLAAGSSVNINDRMLSASPVMEENQANNDAGRASQRAKDYLQRHGITSLVEEFFLELYKRQELPDSPYPSLTRKFRMSESGKDLFRSLPDDEAVCTKMRNSVAVSPELSGVTYVQGSRGVWGMPHVLQMIDSRHLESMKAVVAANEECLHADGEQSAAHDGTDYVVNVWVGLSGPAVLAGKLYSEFWADVHLTVNVEVVSQDFERAVDFFANVILDDANGCQGSNRLLLRHIVFGFRSGTNRGSTDHRDEWTPQQLHDDPVGFVSEIKSSLPLRPSITMHYLFVSPKNGTSRSVGGPIMSVQRSYTMHYRSSTKNTVSLTDQPFSSLYTGVFFSRAEAKNYAEVFRTQGLSFAVEGVAAARECLAVGVERAREIGDTTAMHTALLPLALLSGVNGDDVAAAKATVDIARVTTSPAARHRSLRHLCDSVRDILKVLVGWAGGTEPVLTWDENDPRGSGEPGLDEDNPDNGGRWNPRRHCSNARDLFQVWLRTAHLLFWGWRCDVLLYIDSDSISDAAVLKNKVKQWIDEVSNHSRMGLGLPMVRWHEHARTIAEGKDAFSDAAGMIGQRLASLSGWLHCVELSLAWDAAKVCEGVHARYITDQENVDMVGAHDSHWPLVSGRKQQAHAAQAPPTVPTAVGLFQLQRVWLDEAVLTARMRENGAMAKGRARKNPKRGKERATAKVTVTAASVAAGLGYHPAPIAPNSTRAPAGVDVRHAVIETLREDVVPEAFAHELVLMRYATDNGIDAYLQHAIGDLVSSVLTSNPFPTLTNALAVKSMEVVLRRAVDSEGAVRLPALIVWGKAGERKPSQDKDGEVFGARGSENDTFVFGSRAALAGINVNTILGLFGVLPSVAVWVLEYSEWRGGNVDVNVGICRCALQQGSFAYDETPAELRVMVACTIGYDVNTGMSQTEQLSRLAVYCATKAHKASPLVVICLKVGSSSADGNAWSSMGADGAGEEFPLSRLLSAPEEVESELALLEPDEIVLLTFAKHSISSRGEALGVFSIHFLLTSDAPEQGGGRGEGTVGTLLYDCVYSTAVAAKSVVARHSKIVDSGLPERHEQRVRQLILKNVDTMNYLEGYRLLLHLIELQYIFPGCAHPMSSDTSAGEGANSHGGFNIASLPVEGDGDAQAVAMKIAIARMLKGPAGRLYHARRLVSVLGRLIAADGLAPEALALLEETTFREHAEYAVYCLLDTLAEQPVVRFEGAIESVKLRARLLLDKVREMEGNEGLSDMATRATGADATRATAFKLTEDIEQLLEIIQLAVEADTHQCCPEVEKALEKLRVAERRRVKSEAEVLAGTSAGSQTLSRRRISGERQGAASSRKPSKSKQGAATDRAVVQSKGKGGDGRWNRQNSALTGGR